MARARVGCDAGLRDDREADPKKVYVHLKNTARTCVTASKGTSFGELTCARKNLYGRRMNEQEHVSAQTAQAAEGREERTLAQCGKAGI